jgi:hypothetical protein
MRSPWIFAAVSIFAATPLPASAEVSAAGPSGFVSHNEVEVSASPQAAWDALLRPGDWWSSEHTYSGDASNMRIEPLAAGCFCEVIPADAAAAGEVEHMRVLYFDPRSRTLRMSGALGPLQSEALSGVITMTVESAGAGSKITWDYVVGGYMRMPAEQIAPAVDQVIGEQLARLAALLGKG